MKTRSGSTGFTLLELMIVVAIVAILAGVAVPNFLRLQLRSKRSELTTNLDGARTAEKAYVHEWDVYTTCATRPLILPSRQAIPFGRVPGDRSDWDLLGWMPDGLVRAQYRVDAVNNVPFVQNFSAQAIADMDGNSVQARAVADKTVKPRLLTPGSVY